MSNRDVFEAYASVTSPEAADEAFEAAFRSELLKYTATRGERALVSNENPPQALLNMLQSDDELRGFFVDKYVANPKDAFAAFVVDLAVEASADIDLLKVALHHDAALTKVCATSGVESVVEAFRSTPRATAAAECLMRAASTDIDKLKALKAAETMLGRELVPSVVEERIKAALTPDVVSRLTASGSDVEAVLRTLSPVAPAALLRDEKLATDDDLLLGIVKVFPLYTTDVLRLALSRSKAGRLDELIEEALAHQGGLARVRDALTKTSIIRSRRVDALRTVLVTVGKPWNDGVRSLMSQLGQLEGAADAQRTTGLRFA